MIKIQFPEADFKIIKQSGVEKIFDAFRKQWCVLTPEEWVRQNILVYITSVLEYPATLISIEKEIRLGELKKRCDIIVYRESLPWMIIECKEMSVVLGKKVIDQVLLYHASVPVPYLVVTNGSYTYCFEKKEERFREVDQFPKFERG